VNNDKPIPDWVQQFADSLNAHVKESMKKPTRKEKLEKELAKKQK